MVREASSTEVSPVKVNTSLVITSAAFIALSSFNLWNDTRQAPLYPRPTEFATTGEHESHFVVEARPGADHRCGRRRPERYRDLFPGRCAVRLRNRLDHAIFVPVDGRDPGDQRADRARH